jgi:hypothetical protein
VFMLATQYSVCNVSNDTPIVRFPVDPLPPPPDEAPVAGADEDDDCVEVPSRSHARCPAIASAETIACRRVSPFIFVPSFPYVRH